MKHKSTSLPSTAAPSESGHNTVVATEPLGVATLVAKIMGEGLTSLPTRTPFTDFTGLVRHLPMYGERTVRELVKRKIIPSIRPPGSRKLAFFLPAVEASLLRYSKGGIE